MATEREDIIALAKDAYADKIKAKKSDNYTELKTLSKEAFQKYKEAIAKFKEYISENPTEEITVVPNQNETSQDYSLTITYKPISGISWLFNPVTKKMTADLPFIKKNYPIIFSVNDINPDTGLYKICTLAIELSNILK